MRYPKGVFDVPTLRSSLHIVANREKKNLGQQFYWQGMDGRDEISECGEGGALAVAQFDEGGNL
jgi:hypothetical protein